MPPAPAILNEKLLIAAGGWDAIKHAKAICEAGRVSGATWTAPVLRGTVREGETTYNAGLKIRSFSDVENLCTCRQSRQWGTICAHSLAVGWSLVGRPSAAAGPSSAVSQKLPPSIPFLADSTAKARLHIVLSPDLPAAWKKGSLLAGLEIVGGGQRTLLDGATKTVGALLPEDYRVVEGLAKIIDSSPGGMSLLDRDQFGQWLGSLAGHPRVTMGRHNVLDVSAEAFQPHLQAQFLPGGSLRLEVNWVRDSEPLAADGASWLLLGGRVLRPVAPNLPASYGPLLREPFMDLPAEQASAFLSSEWHALSAHFELELKGEKSESPAPLEIIPASPAFALELEGSLNHLAGSLQARYANGRVVKIGLTPSRETFTFPAADRAALYTRHLLAEEDALDRMRGFGFSPPDSTGQLALRGQDAILRFFARQLPKLREEWTVTLGERFQHVAQRIEVISPEVAVRGSGEDWFDLEIALKSEGGQRFSQLEIQRLLQTGQGSVRLRNGSLAVLPGEAMSDLQEVLRDCDPTQTQPGMYRLQRAQGEYLDSTFRQWGATLAPSWEQWRQKGAVLKPREKLRFSPALEEALRPYQREGVEWLHHLSVNGLSGILADEMGLGKTLQALAYLSATRKKKNADPALVVCPTSLVENWRRECARFTPELSVLKVDGAQRSELFAAVPKVDLAITSYALLRRDIERWRDVSFSNVILDEAHQIKNPDSQVAEAARSLRSKRRFVLTGTPLENSVRDLWSIMHFALPGYLGGRQDFRERYELPLSRPGDPGAENARERLGRRLRPILLRRRKRDVAKELPERIEQTSFCDLTPAQEEVYRGLLEQSRLKLDDARRQKNAGAGRMLVLTALLRLRQACCDLRLLGLEPPSDEPASGKLALLDELLEEVREGGHRVLIFSQFVSMLKLLSEHLKRADIPFAYLDGSTKAAERVVQVDRFQTDESVTAFLISVKAGGVGLNLTGADTVIHFDPWWNPAVEAQATDRAHRIGQTKVVTAYRLIARNTVEEKIFALQNRKRELSAALVERETDEPMLDSLSFEEIEGLLD